MHPTQHRKSHGHVQPAARASFSLSMTLQEHRACVRLQNLSAKQWPEQRSSPPTSAIASSEQRPEQRSAHSAKQWPEQRSSPHSVNHPLPETLSVAVRKKALMQCVVSQPCRTQRKWLPPCAPHTTPGLPRDLAESVGARATPPCARRGPGLGASR